MKIEKINDNQIRCTLSREDLEERHLQLSELAYGTDKAKDLFHEMMGFASAKYGFEAEDIPLMIEAIPINSDTIKLVIIMNVGERLVKYRKEKNLTQVNVAKELGVSKTKISKWERNEENIDINYLSSITTTNLKNYIKTKNEIFQK